MPDNDFFVDFDDRDDDDDDGDDADDDADDDKIDTLDDVEIRCDVDSASSLRLLAKRKCATKLVFYLIFLINQKMSSSLSLIDVKMQKKLIG